MHTTFLRKVGGSVMLAVPPAVLDLLHLKAGTAVRVGVDGGRLVVEPRPRAHYSLDDLLLQCDASTPLSAEEQEWLSARPMGGELL